MKEVTKIFKQYLEDNDLTLLIESLYKIVPKGGYIKLHRESHLIYSVNEIEVDLQSKKNRNFTLEEIEVGVKTNDFKIL